MSLPEAFLVTRCLVRDTFRQSLASRTFWLLLALTGLCVAFCLGVSVRGETYVRPPDDFELYRSETPGTLVLAFGLVELPMARDAADALQFVHLFLAVGVGGTLGMLLVVLWTSGFLPEFLTPDAATVLLAKPVPRPLLLLGKSLGVLCFVAAHITLFVLGTWAALGLRTGYWPGGYLLAIPLLLTQFAILYSFSALLAVLTRSTVLCLFGTLTFWAVCVGVAYARGQAIDSPGSGPGSALQGPLHAAYWVLPKPGDPLQLLAEVLTARRGAGETPPAALNARLRDPELSLTTSLLAAAVLLSLAGAALARRDY